MFMMRTMGMVRMTVMRGVTMAGSLVVRIRRERGGRQQEKHGCNQMDLVHCV
jgi:hypothetical protein